MLGDVSGARVADLYAGSGALGVEALSRGAASATFLESDRRAADVIRANLLTVEEQGDVIVRDVLEWLGDVAGEARFDLVLIDPPYDFAPEVGGTLSQRLPAVLAADALIVTESDKRNPLTLELPLDKERIYGDTRIAVHRGG